MTLTNLQRDRGMCISFFVSTNVASTSPKYELGKVAFSSIRTQEPVPDRRIGALPSLWQTQADPRLVGKTNHNFGGLTCILGLTIGKVDSGPKCAHSQNQIQTLK